MGYEFKKDEKILLNDEFVLVKDEKVLTRHYMAGLSCIALLLTKINSLLSLLCTRLLYVNVAAVASHTCTVVKLRSTAKPEIILTSFFNPVYLFFNHTLL